jgi:hypothetical protein
MADLSLSMIGIHPDTIPTNTSIDRFGVVAGQGAKKRKSAGHKPETGMFEYAEVYVADGRNAAHNLMVSSSEARNCFVARPSLQNLTMGLGESARSFWERRNRTLEGP